MVRSDGNGGGARRVGSNTSGWIDTEKVRPGCSINQAGRRAVRTQQLVDKLNWPVSGDLDTDGGSKRAYGVGWENAHVAIDDHSRVGTSSAARRRPTHLSVPAASRRALRFDGSSSDDSAWLRLEASTAINSRSGTFTPALHPQQRKAERFIRTLKEQWPTAPGQLDVLELYGPSLQSDAASA